MPVRKPAVAGYFYPADPAVLRKDISKFIESAEKLEAIGIVVPHAGYLYSGAVAGKVYSRVEIPKRLIILSPNHTGLGSPFSITSGGAWNLPFGDAPIDEELAGKLKRACNLLEEDAEAQRREHALEVQLPFLQFLKEDFEFVPITLGHIRYEKCEEVGKAIADCIKKEKGPILLIASSDMNHYEEHNTTLKKDQKAIDQILARNPEGLYKTVHDESISMCGIIPTTVMLVATNLLGARKATLIDHKTSGDVTGDKSAVVGYAGIILS